MTPVDVSLNFMPAFYRKHVGLTYGEAFYFDPSHRARVERSEQQFLYQTFGRYGFGSPNPDPNGTLFIQPVDLIMRTQGAEWRFPVDGTVESWGAPWRGLDVRDIASIDPRDAAEHPIIDALLDQYRDLERMYGAQADIFHTKAGLMNIHTPYTTAHQLCGEELLITMLAEPDAAVVIFRKVWDIYEAIYARITAVTGARLTRVQLGDCAASMLSERTYRELVLPVNQEIAGRFESAGYHSCGPSGHLLTAFSELSKVDAIQLGPGTDLKAARHLMPREHLQPLIDPVAMREEDSEAITAMVGQVIDDCTSAPATTLCVWSLDTETPISNVEALLETVHRLAGEDWEQVTISPRSPVLPRNACLPSS